MHFVALACAALLATPALHAQTWPSRPINILVTITPGTGIDLLARTIGQKLIERWGAGVAVDNRPGASGNIARDAWYAMLAPAKVPQEIITRLNAEVNAILGIAEVREQLDKQGLVPVGGPASRLADLIRLELERWPRVVASAGIKAD